jgi:hypothetical protein
LPLVAILIPDSIVPRLFFIVAVFGVGVEEPTAWLPKAKLAAENVTGATAVPVNVTICGEFRPWSVIVITPEMLPVVEGVNVAVMVQVAPAPSVVVHVLDDALKSPLRAVAMFVDWPPVFFTVITLPALVVPTACAANVSLAGVTVITTGAVPVPVSDTVCGLGTALSITVSVPGRLPVVVGENVTDIVQCAFDARLEPHGVAPPATAE